MNRPIVPIILVLLACTAASAGPRADLDGDVRVGFNDNFFRLSSDQLADFASEQAPGEQFFAMSDPEEIVTRLRLRGGLRWKLPDKRRFDLMLLGAYALHQDNDISDYPELGIQARIEISDRARVHVRADTVLDRFWKNYRVPSDTAFAPAVYDQTDLTIGYSRKIGKHARGGASLRHRDRTYETPLQSRDRTGDYVLAELSYRLAKRVSAETELELGKVDVDPISDGGTIVDRSYDQLMARQTLGFKLPSGVFVEAVAQYRVRDSSTGNPADLARFDREDARWRLRVAVNKKLSKRLVLEGRIMRTDNDSDRLDPATTPDETGYEQNVFDIGLRYEFR